MVGPTKEKAAAIKDCVPLPTPVAVLAGVLVAPPAGVGETVPWGVVEADEAGGDEVVTGEALAGADVTGVGVAVTSAVLTVGEAAGVALTVGETTGVGEAGLATLEENDEGVGEVTKTKPPGAACGGRKTSLTAQPNKPKLTTIIRNAPVVFGFITDLLPLDPLVFVIFPACYTIGALKVLVVACFKFDLKTVPPGRPGILPPGKRIAIGLQGG